MVYVSMNTNTRQELLSSDSNELWKTVEKKTSGCPLASLRVSG